MSSSYIDGYGSVDYAAIGETVVEGLRRGDHGTAVEKMQRALLLWDASCLPEYGADGDFGSETEKALKAYQKESGLPVTGIYDEATRKALTSIGKAQRVEATADVFVRSAPGKDNRELGVLKKGHTALYQGEKSAVDGRDWYLIEFNGKNGWVSSKFSKVV
jgi:peptidoglycan hydrolase-like protein with peptidoglycan-binding domain